MISPCPWHQVTGPHCTSPSGLLLRGLSSLLTLREDVFLEGKPLDIDLWRWMWPHYWYVRWRPLYRGQGGVCSWIPQGKAHGQGHQHDQGAGGALPFLIASHLWDGIWLAALDDSVQQGETPFSHF